jgi:4'-phosphopantetheinyl transferase
MDRVTDFTLPLERVDLWYLRMDDPDLPVPQLEGLLAPGERERADQFRFEHLRRNYILSRGSLRVLCSRYLKTHPASIPIRYGPNGKPELEPGCELRFNLSHSGALTIFAFACSLELGVDVERVRAIQDIEAVTRRFFCPEEAADVLGTPEAERAHVFHTCWTRKEAFIKATGDGLSTPLDSFRVTVKDHEAACLKHINFNEDEGRRWTLRALDLPGPYVGALCHRGPAIPLQSMLLTNLDYC